MLSADTIKEIRVQNGLSQSKFSELLGVGLGTLRHWERGDREPTGAARTLLFLISEDKNTIDRLLSKSE
jgi:putative transcriptional regulator